MAYRQHLFCEFYCNISTVNCELETIRSWVRGQEIIISLVLLGRVVNLAPLELPVYPLHIYDRGTLNLATRNSVVVSISGVRRDWDNN